jgi:hypothetical protein
VLHALEFIVGHELKEVADVDDESAGHGRHAHPAAAEQDLQTANAILEEHREEAGIGVPGRAKREVRLRAWRVVVADDADPVQAPGVVLQVSPVEAQSLGQQLQQRTTQPLNLLRVLKNYISAKIACFNRSMDGS